MGQARPLGNHGEWTGERPVTITYLVLALLFIAYHAYRWYAATPYATVPPCTWVPAADAPKVSFLVPAWNAARDIPAFVASYQSITYHHKELILCAGGGDGSFEIAQRFASDGVKVLEQKPGEGKQKALGRSFPASDGDLIYLTDIDCRPSDEVVNNLLAHVADGTAAVATGASRPLDDQRSDPFVLTQWAVEQATQPRVPTNTSGLLGRNAALTRAAVDATGGFATSAPSGTDYTLAKEVLREGFDIRFVPGSPMPTEYPATFGMYARKQARWIRNVFVLGGRHGATAEVRATLLTLLLPYSLCCLLLVAVVGVGLAGFLALLFVVHAVINRLRHLHRANLPLDVLGALRHFLADQAAALRAGWQIVNRRTTW